MRRAALLLAGLLLAPLVTADRAARAQQVPNPMARDAANAQQPQARINLGLGPSVSITDYGADPTGATSSEAAFASCVTSGKDCRIPAGTYQLGCATHQAPSGITVQGEGARVSVLKLSAGCAMSANFLSGANVKDLAIDMNGGSAGIYTVISPTYPANSTPIVERTRITGGAPAGYLIAVSNATSPVIRGNYLAFNANATSANRCLLFTQAGGPITGGEISDNRCVNSSIWVEADGVRIGNNDISGWAYSSAIGFEASAGNKKHIITGNYLHDSALTTDVDGTASLGMEIWASDVLVEGNTCVNLGGGCMDIGGQRSLVSNNHAYGVNKRNAPGGAAFSARYTNATFNANNSHFVGNLARDDGSGTQYYGYVEQSASLSGVTLASNNFAGNVTGPTNILSSSTQNGIATCSVATAGATITIRNGLVTGLTGC